MQLPAWELAMNNRVTTQLRIDDQLEWVRGRHFKTTPATTKPQATQYFPSNAGELPRFDPGALPNHLNRSSFIAPIGRGLRPEYKREVLVSRSDCKIEYTGEQLDEADGDILMILLYLTQGKPIGRPIKMNRSKILKLLQRETGLAQYKWLLRRIKSMTEATLFLETKTYKIGATCSFRIISSFFYNHESGDYFFILDQDWVKMFSNREFSRIDWEKRMSIGRQLNIAKAIQRLIATDSSKTQRYSIDYLKTKFVYTGRMSDFIDALNKNIAELKRLAIVRAWEISQSYKGNQQLILHIN